MDRELEQNLCKQYLGREVNAKNKGVSWADGDCLLEANSTIDDGDLEISVSMSVSVDISDNKIDDISVSFSTSCDGDSGIGDCDPGEFFEYFECYNAAKSFIEEIVEE